MIYSISARIHKIRSLQYATATLNVYSLSLRLVMTTWNVDTIKKLAKYIKCVFYRITSEQSLKQLINLIKKEFS